MASTRYCPVTPPAVLESLLNVKFPIGSSHLLLAHDVVKVERSADYAWVFRAMESRKDRLIIMDNSLIETGAAIDLDTIQEACEITKANIVVLPDVQLDGKQTAELSTEAISHWAREFRGTSVEGFMYVPQGKTLLEFTQCAEASLGYQGITMWGIPRNLVKVLGTRSKAIQICQMLDPYRRVHMMGFSDDMIDDFYCATRHRVFSIDSAVPVRLNEEIFLSTKPPPRGDWWERAKPTPFTQHNVTKVRGWLD